MEKLQEFFSSFKTLIGFLILCIFIQMIFGDKVLTNFLWLILFSMLIINYQEFTSFMQNLNKEN